MFNFLDEVRYKGNPYLFIGYEDEENGTVEIQPLGYHAPHQFVNKFVNENELEEIVMCLACDLAIEEGEETITVEDGTIHDYEYCRTLLNSKVRDFQEPIEEMNRA